MTLLTIVVFLVLTSKSIDIIIPNGAFFSSLILLEESLARLASKCFHLLQRTVTLRLAKQATGQDQTQQCQAAQIEL